MLFCDYPLDYKNNDFEGKKCSTACSDPKTEDERLSDKLCY